MNFTCVEKNYKKSNESKYFTWIVIEYLIDKINKSDKHINRKKNQIEKIERYRWKLQKAYYLAKICHWEKRRKDGSLYLTHPQSVAEILLYEIPYIDIEIIIIWLLHDILENYFMKVIKNDPEISEMVEIKWKVEWVKILEILFGKDIAESINKLSKNKVSSLPEEEKIYRDEQYFLDIQYYDDKTLLGKIADRLHNLRTIEVMGLSHIQKKINETKTYFLPVIGDRIENIKLQLQKKKRKDWWYYNLETLLKTYEILERLLTIEIDRVTAYKLQQEELRKLLAN